MRENEPIVLETSVTRSGQSVDLQQLRRCEGRCIRIKIRSDSYRAQCYASAYMWDAHSSGWNEVWTIPGEAMHTKDGLAYARHAAGLADFQEDIDALVRIILFLD